MRDNKKLVEECLPILPQFFHKLSRPLLTQVKMKLPPNQLWMMGELIRHGALTMTEISNYLRISKQQATQTVDKMIRQGLVQRQPDPDDRRKIHVVITDEGRELVKNCRALMAQQMEEKISALSDEDYEKLHTALEMMRELVEKL